MTLHATPLVTSTESNGAWAFLTTLVPIEWLFLSPNGPSGQNGFDRGTAADDQRAGLLVEDVARGGDPQAVEDRGGDVGGPGRVERGVGAAPVRRTVQLAAPNSAS